MGVSLAKLGDDVAETVRDANMNDGAGRLNFVGGMPAHKVDGAVIRLTGGMLRCVTIERTPAEFGTLTVATTYMTDGTMHRDTTWAGFEATRTAWLRYAVANGIYAGVGRMR
jgi:hypothetical protein